jgi:ABC-2 type transport system ATP-binding protein
VSTPDEVAAPPAPTGVSAAREASGLVVEELVKRFGTFDAVRGISFTIAPGEIFGLLGPNGAGKTTTLSMLATLLPPSGGDARIFGTSIVSDVGAVRRLVGLAPQEIGLYPDLTARENLTFFGRLYGLGGQALRERTEELLGLVGLAGRADDRVRNHSGGMQRRLNLACALVHRPRLLMLDEPTAGVDPQSREHVLDAIRALARGGTTVLYTTHYMEEAEQLCDRLAIMDEGRIMASGTLAELLHLVGLGDIIEVRGAIASESRLGDVPGLQSIDHEPGRAHLLVTDASKALGAVAALAAERPGTLETLDVRPVDLKQLFMHLTGKSLRD